MAKILYAEDDDAMRVMVTDILSSANHEVQTVPDGNAALEALRKGLPDLIVLDYRMGEPNGFEVCRQIKTNPRYDFLPVLMLTAENDIEDRIEGFGAGANDYLPKPFDARELIARVTAMVKLSEQGRELNPTTGLPGNRSIEKEFDRRRSEAVPFTMAYLDLDYFKPFNDKFGFPIANSLIEGIGRLLRSMVNETEHFAGHIGGDDFVLISDRSNALDLVTRVQQGFIAELHEVVPPEVVERGSYRGVLRNGEEADVPLTRLGAALLHLEPPDIPSLEELSEIAADAKHEAKEEKETGTIERIVQGQRT